VKEEREANNWLEIVRKNLETLYPPAMWKEKLEVAKQLSKYLRVQFEYDLRRYMLLLSRMANITDHTTGGAYQRRISGVLQMLVDKQWKDYFFVLVGNSLIYSADTRESVPLGLIVLKYSSITVYEAFVRENKYIWTIETPLKNYHLICKHGTLLSEWLLACELSMLKTPIHTNCGELLKVISHIHTDTSTIEAIMQQPAGYRALKEFIQKEDHKICLRFWKDVQRYWKLEFALHTSREQSGDPSKALANHFLDMRTRFFFNGSQTS